MQRFQSSWLIETILDNVTEQKSDSSKWYFPCVYGFLPMGWLGQRNIKITLNVPIYSQAILARSWFLKSDMFPQEDILAAFNQILMKNIDIKINPFRAWQGKYFNEEQLNYLLYWHEAANELNNDELKEAFLAMVFQVINYWISNNKEESENVFKPDEVLALYYKQYKNFREHLADFTIIEKPFCDAIPLDCSTIIFNVCFNEEDILDNESLIIYDSWVRGHTDIEDSKKLFKNNLRRSIVELGNYKNFEFYRQLSAKAKSAAFCWSGKGMSPAFFKRFFVDPLLAEMSLRYKQSKFVYKCIDAITEEYDFILLCF